MTAAAPQHHHPHDLDHPGHEHPHGDPVESYAHVRGGPPVLDIGGDIGALLATMPASAAGTELHLRSEDRPDADIHTGVWRRGSGADAVTSAVFAELAAGSYWVLDDLGRQAQRIEVRGGELAATDLRRSHPWAGRAIRT